MAGGARRRTARRAFAAAAALLCLALALALAPAGAHAQRGSQRVALDPDLPDGAAIFRAVCREAGFSGARRALGGYRAAPVDFSSSFSVFATALTAGGSAVRGDPARKGADDVVVTIGTAELDGVPFDTCSTLSFLTPLAALRALGASPGETAAIAAAPAETAFRIRPRIFAATLAAGVPGSRGVTVLTVAGFAPDAPGTLISLDSVSPGGAARLAAALAVRALLPDPYPTYEDALRRLEPTPDGPASPSESVP